MVSIQQYLISGRFLTTFGHLVALLLLFATVDNNIEISLGDSASSADKEEAVNNAWSALIIGFLCFLCDFSGLFFGTTLFYNTGNMLHIFLHFCGSLLLSWVVTDTWNYKAIWPIVVFCNLPTALYELTILLAIRVLRIIVY
mmetsp:Transcript_8104/g.13477  ORF Transcript_8104/g.13477 Transcript_8104/m.13477 type:complete len:142 (+) Transcript_8104:104-529(+)